LKAGLQVAENGKMDWKNQVSGVIWPLELLRAGGDLLRKSRIRRGGEGGREGCPTFWQVETKAGDATPSLSLGNAIAAGTFVCKRRRRRMEIDFWPLDERVSS